MCLHVGGVQFDGCGIYCICSLRYSQIVCLLIAQLIYFPPMVDVVSSNYSTEYFIIHHQHTTSYLPQRALSTEHKIFLLIFHINIMRKQ